MQYMGFRARGEISIDRTWRCGLRREWNRGSEGDSLDAATGGSLAYLVGSPGEDGLQSGPDRGLRSYFLVNQAREAHLEHKEDENLDIYRINMINHAQLKNKEALSLLLWVECLLPGLLTEMHRGRERTEYITQEGRRTMILSVLSSPALVSGLMVARAKNPRTTRTIDDPLRSTWASKSDIAIDRAIKWFS
ncbi:unnamed protein product [Dovyalis caffra]|uniref:Uncharacterized protein n=2 Tax=Dovyalis caffra TaxID=77055 RepID=A0AAV1R4F2_9ROSI|nr:unnamed protein product [Dovyalis caffra]